MKKASEYRQHAHECRVLARKMSNEDECQQLLQMADQWERMASERERLIVAALREADETASPESESSETWRRSDSATPYAESVAAE